MSVLLRNPPLPSGLGIGLPAVPLTQPVASKPKRRDRDRIWDLSPNLHCSVIGTCLTTGELRQLLAKFGQSDARTATSHVIHHRAVQAAGREDLGGKLLNKLLDRKHESFVKRFSKAETRDELAVLWRDALEAGDIPGAYWATMTHPLADDALVREVFGEVHMLSHLVGTSNRLDLARLKRLEEDLARRDETITKQQARLNEKAAELRNSQERVEELEAEARIRLVGAAHPLPDDRERLEALRRAEAAEARCRHLERDLAEAREARKKADLALAAAEGREAELGRELAQADALLDKTPEADEDVDFRDMTLLYVGGRPGQVDQLREILLARGGVLLTHDGGVENSHSLLPGLVARAEAVFFPVDCVSHAAMNLAKKHCRDMGKSLIPVRHASVASFLAAAAHFAAHPGDGSLQPRPGG